MAWQDHMRIDAEQEYQDLFRSGVFPADVPCKTLKAMLKVAEDETKHEWVLGAIEQIMGHVEDQVRGILEKPITVGEGDDQVKLALPPTGQRLIGSIATTWALLHFVPYARVHLNIAKASEDLIKSVTWENGIVERLMVASAIQFKTLHAYLKEEGFFEKVAAHFGVHDEGREAGEPGSE